MKILGLVVLCIVLSSVISLVGSYFFFQSANQKSAEQRIKGVSVSSTPTVIPTQSVPTSSIIPTKEVSVKDCKDTYDRQSAKNEGYTDEEINDYLSSLPPGPCPKQSYQPQTIINNTLPQDNNSKSVNCTTQYVGTMAYTYCN